MAENVQTILDEYLKGLENVMKTGFQRIESFHPSDAAISSDFINDFREITMNRYVFSAMAV